MRKTFVAWVIASLLGRGAATGLAQTTLPAFKLTVSPKGDIALLRGDKTLASGHWEMFDAQWHAFDADQYAAGPVISSTATQDTPTHAVVTDTYVSAKAITDIKLEGEDLRLIVHLQNLDAKRALKNVALNGLTFHFARNASGTLRSWHISYIGGEGNKLFHPGLAQPLGAVFAHDDQFGFCVYSASEFDHQSLFNANFQKDGIIPAECKVDFYTQQTVAQGQSIDIDTHFRITGDFSISHLLEDYKKVYTAHFPALLYHADDRPVGQFAAVGKNLVTRTNPLGYGGAFRRLDSAVGTNTYIRLVAPTLQHAGALGIIFWSPGGLNPPMYPPDFDQFPASVQQNIPALIDGFKNHQLRVGLCARCGDGVIREEGKDPQVYRLSAMDPGQMKTLMDRFDHAMKMGFDMFYLDSFGVDNPNDLEILKQVRSKVGPDVLLYTEFCTDMTLPYAGHYCEWRDNSILWTSDDQYTAMRYLCPDSTWLCISRTNQPVPQEFTKLRLATLVEDSAANRLPATRPNVLH